MWMVREFGHFGVFDIRAGLFEGQSPLWTDCLNA